MFSQLYRFDSLMVANNSITVGGLSIMHKLGSAVGFSVLIYMLFSVLIGRYQEQMFYNRLIKRLYFVKSDDENLFKEKA